MRGLLLGSALAGLAAFSLAPAHADDMVFTSWGGTTQDAQGQAWAEPFSGETGINVVMDGPTDYGKLKAMVESGNVTWNVVDVEHDFAIKAAEEGLLEPIDFSVANRDVIDPRFVTDNAVGSFYYSFVLGYNEDALGGDKPQSWADLFDTDKFPGKRTFYKMVGTRRARDRAAGRRREARGALSARPRPGFCQARHGQGRHPLVGQRRAVAAAAGLGRGAAVLERPRRGGAGLGPQCRDLLGAEPDRCRHAGRAPRRAEQGGRDAIPGHRNGGRAAGRVRPPDPMRRSTSSPRNCSRRRWSKRCPTSTPRARSTSTWATRSGKATFSATLRCGNSV